MEQSTHCQDHLHCVAKGPSSRVENKPGAEVTEQLVLKFGQGTQSTS